MITAVALGSVLLLGAALSQGARGYSRLGRPSSRRLGLLRHVVTQIFAWPEAATRHQRLRPWRCIAAAGAKATSQQQPGWMVRGRD